MPTYLGLYTFVLFSMFLLTNMFVWMYDFHIDGTDKGTYIMTAVLALEFVFYGLSAGYGLSVINHGEGAIIASTFLGVLLVILNTILFFALGVSYAPSTSTCTSNTGTVIGLGVFILLLLAGYYVGFRYIRGGCSMDGLIGSGNSSSSSNLGGRSKSIQKKQKIK